MVELGELESAWREFEKRKVRVVVVSLEGADDAKATQADFPHLQIVSDPDRKLLSAVEAVHARAAPDGSDAAAPTTLLFDGGGTVRYVYRPARVFDRLSPPQLLAAIDRELAER